MIQKDTIFYASDTVDQIKMKPYKYIYSAERMLRNLLFKSPGWSFAKWRAEWPTMQQSERFQKPSAPKFVEASLMQIPRESNCVPLLTPVDCFELIQC